MSKTLLALFAISLIKPPLLPIGHTPAEVSLMGEATAVPAIIIRYDGGLLVDASSTGLRRAAALAGSARRFGNVPNSTALDIDYPSPGLTTVGLGKALRLAALRGKPA